MNIVKHKIVTCVFATVALCSGIVAHPQENPVKLEFKVNQKPTNKKIRIILYANGVATEPHVSDDGTFLFPSLDDEWVDVRLLLGNTIFYTHTSI